MHAGDQHSLHVNWFAKCGRLHNESKIWSSFVFFISLYEKYYSLWSLLQDRARTTKKLAFDGFPEGASRIIFRLYMWSRTLTLSTTYKRKFDAWMKVAASVGLRMNKDKTNILKVKTVSPQTVRLASGHIGEVEEFTNSGINEWIMKLPILVCAEKLGN